MARHLVLSLRLHEDGCGTARYHGMSQGAAEWPPAPARVYQALVAGVACGNALPERFVAALHWLEALPPPIVAAPWRTLGQSVSLFVPNNDADALSDPTDVSSIRTAKVVQPSLFAAHQPILYAWALHGDATPATAVVEAAHRLYQLGRGVDMAWAVAELMDADALEARLAAHRGPIHRPDFGARSARMLACPVAGSLTSLLQRHRATKLRVEGSGRSARVLFTNPPKPRFASVSYARARSTLVYELRDRLRPEPWPWALGRVVTLVERLRDQAAARLLAGLVGDEEAIALSLAGRAADGSSNVQIGQRVRIVPLPSIGSPHADRAIRRVLVEIPSGAPVRAGDVEWAFSGLEWADPETGELSPLVVTKGDTNDMLAHYAGPSRRWRSVTALVLPESARRRRIDPARRLQDAKTASERLAEETRAIAAVQAALRHAQVGATAITVHVQREPFEARGVRAETFAAGTRFAKERLWHVEMELNRSVEGPLVVGDGRFVGLGVMAPLAEPWQRPAAATSSAGPVTLPPAATGIFVLELHGSMGALAGMQTTLARALRRAVMARVRDTLGLTANAGLDRFFSGHEPDGTASSRDAPRHLAFQWDGASRRLLVIAPHRLERREAGWHERQMLSTLDRALDGLVDLRAGAAGYFGVRRLAPSPDDPLLAAATCWSSATAYVVTRHRRCASASEALIADVTAECKRTRLPRPEITVRELHAIPGRGLQGHLRLEFPAAVSGPIALGRTSQLGGGLFTAVGPV